MLIKHIAPGRDPEDSAMIHSPCPHGIHGPVRRDRHANTKLRAMIGEARRLWTFIEEILNQGLAIKGGFPKEVVSNGSREISRM